MSRFRRHCTSMTKKVAPVSQADEPDSVKRAGTGIWSQDVRDTASAVIDLEHQLAVIGAVKQHAKGVRERLQAFHHVFSGLQ